MLQIAKRARLPSSTTCHCFLRPLHLSSPLASSSSASSPSPSSSTHPTPTSTTESLADRLQKRRPAPSPPTDPSPPSSADASSPQRSSSSANSPPSLANTTSRLNRLVQSLTDPPSPTRPSSPNHQRSETQKASSQPSRGGEASKGKGRPSKMNRKRAEGRAKVKAARQQGSTSASSSSSPRRRPRLHPSDAAVREPLPTLEERRLKSELRIAFLHKTLVEPWDQLDESKKELQAWKAEQRAEAKARNERQAEEEKKAKNRFDDGGIAGSLLSLSDPSATPPPPPRLKARPGDRGPATSRKDNSLYSEYERQAKERWELRRHHQISELVSHETRLEKVLHQIEQQQAAEAVKLLEPAQPKRALNERSPQPSLLTTFAEKLELGSGKAEQRQGASQETGEVTSKEELAKELQEVLPSREMAQTAGVPYRRPPQHRTRRDRLASHQERRPETPSPNLSRLPPLSSYPHHLTSTSTPFTPLPRDPTVPIATLSHGLTRVLFNPGVHFVRDPRSGVYNFPRRALENIPPVEEFELGKMPAYITSSKDEVLSQLAKSERKQFVGSTSSTVAMLCQIYFWLSKGKPVNLDMLSASWQDATTDFSAGQRLPASVVLHHRDDHYAIDADKSMDATLNLNILADYGHMMEKLLTTDPDEFARFLKTSPDPAPSLADEKQAYQYSTTEHMILRSQLDAHDEHLPNVSFDVKTRGSVAVRQDRLNYVEAAGYDVHTLQGPWESFEREYYDLIRSAFLKYQFQARIGGMDGCFVAYHSTQRFFGFQYVPIPEMDAALFGSSQAGEQVFKLSLGFLETILLEAKECYPGQSIKVTFAAGQAAFVSRQEDAEDVLRVFVSPYDEDPETVIKDVTLLELRGTNYLNGQPQMQVDILPKPRNSSSAESTSEDEDSAADFSAAEDDSTPVWQVGYNITKSSTTDVEGYTSPSSPSRVPPHEILRLLAATREFQSMFSSLTLPAGVSRADVVAAARRQAEQAAEAAEGEAEELDPSDLAVRFPMADGMDYKSRPSRSVMGLRAMSQEGKRRSEEREAAGRVNAEIESRKKVWQ
ncbi:mitochondrial protein Pet127-domain-containing protein [Leucosporidium creatinivorum]|uniref:Mitochondrial protein Pet127-domain-containing protein n=1 Tax=Leucosporidium creatinivorum TaxID=106004 RepID=A0A1Y2G2F3_9BASI|nr:mitochondrial protein Pet127-domain-containing protein [Leucosporidium creatinivorum]